MTSHDTSPLTAQRSWALPLAEASALAWRSGAGGVELLSVDDGKFRIARAAVTADDIVPPPDPDRVKAAFESRQLPTGKSNFEGVAADGTGRIFLVQENDERIAVLTPDLRTVERIIRLHVRPDEPDLGPQWCGEPNENSRAEGLLLLVNGHILVAKQRSDPWLLEFGPAGDAAVGLNPTTVLPSGESFDLPTQDSTYQLLAKWLVSAGAGPASLNDLAVDDEGRVYVVSSVAAVIARLRGELTPDGPDAAFDSWSLPREALPNPAKQKAEGLVYWPRHGWLVAVDLGGDGARNQPNLFLIAGVPD